MIASARLFRAALAAVVLSAGGGQALAQDAETIRTAEALRDRAMEEGTIAVSVVEQITTRFGPRLAGTEAERRAAEWGSDYLASLGLSNVAIQDFPLAVWRRHAERVEIVGTWRQPLVATALGGSPSTPAEGIEAEAVVFETYQDLLDAEPGSLNGKIALVLQDTVRAQDGRGYGATSPIRGSGPVEAANRGAIGFVLRSLGTHDHRFAHAGATRWSDTPIPSFAISPPDADQIRRILDIGGPPLRLRLFSQVSVEPAGRSQNVIAEVRGTEAGEEVIVIGGHLDSWDHGTGAIDDAAGIAITTAALHMINQLPERPRRTIRVVWWGSEEVSQPGGQGLSGAFAYARSQEDEIENHVVASESDFGAGPIYALSLPEVAANTDFQRAAMRVLTPLGVVWDATPARGGGPDTVPLNQAGVPSFRLAQDGSDYFNFHHTADDVLDRIDPDNLDQNVAAWAALLWLIANSDVDFRAAPAAE